jgi:hypothetical protein
MQVAFTILGEPASKANSRKIVTIANRPAVVKSAKALNYSRAALLQIPSSARQRLKGPVRVALRIYYASERPDLDESLILDLLQDQWKRDKRTGKRVLLQPGVYCNDRQVRRRYVEHAIDRANPRTEVVVAPMVMQAGGDLFAALEDAAHEIELEFLKVTTERYGT